MILLDSVALGFLRHELVETVGSLATRSLLTRMGYAAGHRIARAMQEEHPDLWKEKRVGPFVSPLAGFFVFKGSTRTDGREGRPLIESYCQDSFEVDHQLFPAGRSAEPVCWISAGFASGYVSYLEGREVYFIEEQCAAQGHPSAMRWVATARNGGTRWSSSCASFTWSRSARR